MSELLKEARCYVADALEAHEHSDGRDLLNRIDAALRAEPGWQPISSAPRELPAITHEDACRLGIMFGRSSDLRTSQDIRINEWLKSLIVHSKANPLFIQTGEDVGEYRALVETLGRERASPAHAELSPGNSSDLRGEEG